MTETVAVAALISCCAIVAVLAGRDIALNWLSTDADNFKATAHLKGRTGAVAAAVCAPLLALASWPAALFALTVGVFCLFVPPEPGAVRWTRLRPAAAGSRRSTPAVPSRSASTDR